MVSRAISQLRQVDTTIGGRNTPVLMSRARAARHTLRLLKTARRRARAAYIGRTVPRRLISTGGRIFTMPEQKFLSIADAQLELGISRSGLYRLIAAGELDRIRIGGRPKITRRSIDRYVDYQLLLVDPQRRGA